MIVKTKKSKQKKVSVGSLQPGYCFLITEFHDTFSKDDYYLVMSNNIVFGSVACVRFEDGAVKHFGTDKLVIPVNIEAVADY